MRLITVDNYELSVAPEALLIKPIRMLWNQDRSRRKERFYEQMSYLYHMTDPRSSYSYLMDEAEREKAVIEQEGLPADFKPSKLLSDAMEIYKKHTITASQKLLESALIAADTVSTFLRDKTILTQLDDKGKPRYQISSVTTALKNVEGIVASLKNLQKQVDAELEEKGKARGSQELTIMDIGID